LVDYGEFGASWVGETATRSETTTTTLEKITIPAHEISAMPKATQRLLDDSAFDLETWIADRVAEKFTLTENSAFISGDGTDKPKGILSQTMIANTSWSWGKIGYIPTGNPSSFTSTNQHDVLIDVIYALKADYRAGAVWIMNSKTASTIRKFKDAEGRYLWNEGGDATQQANLLGYPVFISENMPNLGTDTYPILFGNFSLGYTIVDGQDIRTLRDPYSAKPHILFYTTKRVGGNVTNFEAIKALKCATT
jgi:HK97 family phage major capsid protein